MHLSFGKQYSNQRNIHVFGRDGSIFIDFLNNLYLVQKKSVYPDYLDPMANGLRYIPPAVSSIKDFSKYAMSKLKLTDRSDSFFATMKYSVAAFYGALSTQAPLPCEAQDGTAVIRACEAWVRAADVPDNPAPPVYQLGASPEDHILVTGATGFIGRCLVEQLVQKGHNVRILVRNTNGLPRAFLSEKVHIFKGDITDADSVAEAVKGVRFVYHLAHSLGKTWEEFEYFNINPARFLAQACLKEDARFIFASTIAVFYYADIPGSVVRFDSSIDSKPKLRNLYARSKIVEENLLKQIQADNGLRLVITRPGIVVGRNGILEHSGIGLWTRDNVCAYWGQGNSELPLVLVEDTASALIAMMQKDGIEGNSFNLVGDVRLTAREYVAALRRFSQRDITAFAYPSRLMYLSDAFKILIKKIGRDKNTFLSYRDLANRSVSAKFDTSFEKSTLSWQPCRDNDYFINGAFGWQFEK
jgi:nucleoside-diphosphate-sugar epimerase